MTKSPQALKTFPELLEAARASMWETVSRKDPRAEAWKSTEYGWYLAATYGKKVTWSPQKGPQTALLTCPVHEVFFGGARGGGKTDAMLGDFAQHAAMHGRGAVGIFFRRRFKQLEEVLRRSREIYGPLGATYNIGTATWTFPNGATLKLRHLFDLADAGEYQGHSYTWLCFEELTNWPDPSPINALRGTLRSGTGVPTYFRATGNPGGPGHAWVKARYISPWPRGYRLLKSKDTGLLRVFIPSKLSNNAVLQHLDPLYDKRLKMTGDASLVRAWLEGDWDIAPGGFFDDVFKGDTHVLTPFSIPDSWEIGLSFDWGSAKPASLGVWARSNGECEEAPFYMPPGSIVRIGEWYTVDRDVTGAVRPDVGLRLTNRDLGRGIGERVVALGRGVGTAVADPSVFKEEGGPSIHEQIMIGVGETECDFAGFDRADNARVAGWQKMRDMLANAHPPGPGRRREFPGLWVFSSCTEWLRTVPVLPRDDKKPDDVNSKAEDHAADETRYFCQTVEWSREGVEVVGFN